MSRRVRLFFDGLLVLALFAAIALGAYALLELRDTLVGGVAVGLAVAAILAIGGSFLLSAELRASLTVAGIACLIPVWVANWLLHDTSTRDSRAAEAARAAGVFYDTRSPLEVTQALREQGVDAYPALSGGPLDNDPRVVPLNPNGRPPLPLAGVSRATTVICNELGEYLIIETDRFGFNNPDDVYDTPSSVLLLGDSFAFGNCVPNEHNVAGHLRANGVDIVNIGYRGTGPLMQLAQLREYGYIVRPEVIIWMFYSGNDLDNLRAELASRTVRRYLDPGYTQDLAARQDEVDALWSGYVEDRLAAHQLGSRQTREWRDLLLLGTLRQRLGLVRSRAERDPDIASFEHVTRAIIAEVDDLAAEMYFVYLPSYRDFIGEHFGFREDVLDVVHSYDIPIVDFETTLRATGDPLAYYPFRMHGHFNETGYALLAEQILREVPGLRDDEHAPELANDLDSQSHAH